MKMILVVPFSLFVGCAPMQQNIIYPATDGDKSNVNLLFQVHSVGANSEYIWLTAEIRRGADPRSEIWGGRTFLTIRCYAADDTLLGDVETFVMFCPDEFRNHGYSQAELSFPPRKGTAKFTVELRRSGKTKMIATPSKKI